MMPDRQLLLRHLCMQRRYKKAGFHKVKLERIGPKWYDGERQHGLIMGCVVTGTKPTAGDSPLKLPPKVRVRRDGRTRPVSGDPRTC
eukprot:scaffold324_cov394-Prasinococcus_capsulatus_cf.AAC.3